jgi:DNA polymerase-3 subunit delta
MSDFKTLHKDIKSGKLAPGSYIFYGDEPYFMDLLSDMAAEHIIPDSEKDFCQKIFYGMEVDGVTLRDICMTSPMSFSAEPKQLIIVKEAQKFEKNTDIIFKYIANPNPQTILILVFNNKDKERDANIPNKKIPKNAQFYNSAKFKKDAEFIDFINKYFDSKNKKVEPNASQMLFDYLGTDLSKIANEIEKLIISKPEATVYKVQDIQDGIGMSKDFNLFEYINQLSQGNYKKLFQIVKYFLNNPKEAALEPIMINLYEHFKKLYLIKLGLKDHISQNDIATAIYPPHRVWAIKNDIAFCDKFSILELEEILILLNEYNMKSKGQMGANYSYDDILKELTIKIMPKR